MYNALIIGAGQIAGGLIPLLIKEYIFIQKISIHTKLELIDVLVN